MQRHLIIDLYVDSLVSIINNKRLFGENWMCILVSDMAEMATMPDLIIENKRKFLLQNILHKISNYNIKVI